MQCVMLISAIVQSQVPGTICEAISFLICQSWLTCFLSYFYVVQIRCDVADRRTGEIVDKSLYFKVKVKDINDNAPEFHKKEFNITVKESHKRGEDC